MAMSRALKSGMCMKSGGRVTGNLQEDVRGQGIRPKKNPNPVGSVLKSMKASQTKEKKGKAAGGPVQGVARGMGAAIRGGNFTA